MKKVIVLWLFLWLVNLSEVKAQDAQFSQFYSNPLYLAPSFAGLTGETRVTTNYRDQWPSMPGSYHTYSVSVDHAINAFNSGMGLIVLNDKAGSGNLSLTDISLQYAYSIKMSDTWHCVPGLYFSYLQRSVDYQKLIWHDQITTQGTSSSSVETLPLDKVISLDFGTSVLAYSDKFWVGMSIDHILRPNESFYITENNTKNFGYIPVKYSVFGGTKIINQGRLLRPYDTSVQLAFLYKQQEKYRQFDMGMYWFNKPLVLGFWYRGIPVLKPFPNQDAFTILVGIKNDFFTIGYSYDFTISKLVGSTGGAHELSMSYSFKAQLPHRSRGAVPCPDF